MLDLGRLSMKFNLAMDLLGDSDPRWMLVLENLSCEELCYLQRLLVSVQTDGIAVE